MKFKLFALMLFLCSIAISNVYGQENIYILDEPRSISKLDSIRNLVSNNLIATTKSMICESITSNIYSLHLLKIEELEKTILIEGEYTYSCHPHQSEFVKIRFRLKIVPIFGSYEVIEIDFDKDLNGSYESQILPTKLYEN